MLKDTTQTESTSSAIIGEEQQSEIVLKTAILLHLANRVAFERKKYCLRYGRDERHFSDLNVIYTDELIKQRSRLDGVDAARAKFKV